MKICVPREISDGEKRVAIVPKMARRLIKEGNEVFLETGAGAEACFPDTAYEQVGVKVVKDRQILYSYADAVFKVQPPESKDVELMKDSSIYLGYLAPFTNVEAIRFMQKKKITGFSMELIPRIARSQNMDALSSMANIAGYRSVLIAAQLLGKFFPLMMTAAGTVAPAKVLIIGAGVSGLQAIATARRLGARVEAFDTRPAAKEQVESLGAQFIEMELVEDAEAASGYAKEMTDRYLEKEREIIGNRASESNVVITTAQVFGKKAPILITDEMVKVMQPGSVIIDLAAEQGGNCELTERDKTVNKYGISICGSINLPATLPIDASMMYANNITNFFLHLYKAEDKILDFEDLITKNSCVTFNGVIVNETVKAAIPKEDINI